LGETEIERIATLGKERVVEAGQVVVKEGESASELFIVIEGRLEIGRWDAELQQEQLIGTVGPGDTVGEVALLDGGVRAATVRATERCRLLHLGFADLKGKIETDRNYLHLFYTLAANISGKLRTMNQLAVEEMRIRRRLETLLIVLIATLSGVTYALPGMRYLLRIASTSTQVALPATLAMSLLLFIAIKYFKMPLHEVGITTRHLGLSLKEGFLLALPPIFLGVMVKWAIVHSSPERALIEVYANIQDPAHQNWRYWLLFNASYWFLMVPVQELLVRGVLQGLLERLLTGKRRLWSAIVVSNLIFSATHVFFSPLLAFSVLLGGMWLGWIYSRTYNLAGVSLAHAMMGTAGFSIVGVSGILF
jgi:CRP-like cAMP-binding protein